MNWSNAGWLGDDNWYKNKVISGSLTTSFIGITTNITAGATATYTSASIGTADPTRIVVIAIASGITAGNAVTGVTLAGSACTHATSTNNGSGAGASCDIWYIAVPTGTSANIVITWAGSETRSAIAVYTVIGSVGGFSVGSSSNSATGVTTLSSTATIPAGGCAISVLSIHASATAGTITNGANIPIDNTGTAFGNSCIGAGHNTSGSGSTTFTYNWTTAADCSMAVATFSP